MSNMYEWADGDKGTTWNPIGGECAHNCQYCYVLDLKVRYPATGEKYEGPPRLWAPALKGSPGKGTIFVCSMTDLFADNVPSQVIGRVMDRARAYPDNTYLFQTKNPARLRNWVRYLPPNYILGTTIETDKVNGVSKAPPPVNRAASMVDLPRPKMVTIEPVLDFNLKGLVSLIEVANPDFINIGADSKNNGLKEPPAWKVHALIKALEKDYEVRLKSNLERLL